jgi:hypothetical protein
MGFPGNPNSQGNAAASIPVWIDVPPAATGPYPNNKNLTGGATPVYEVAAPTGNPPYPNNQGTSTTGVNRGAIPIRVVAQPAAGAHSNDPTHDAAAIPVYVVGTNTGILPVYPNAQGNVHGAQPVWIA